MTELQIKYQALQLDRERVARELELNERQLSEVERHNRETEDVARENLAVSWHTAESTRMNAQANQMNAATNRLNYGVNLMNARTNQYNAETNRLNYGVNLMNAQTNQYNAETSRLNYSVNLMNAETNRRSVEIAEAKLPAELSQIEANTAYTRASATDLEEKSRADYWQSTAYSNYGKGTAYGTKAISSLPSLSKGSNTWYAVPDSGTGTSSNVLALPSGKSGTSHSAGSSAATFASGLLGTAALTTILHDNYTIWSRQKHQYKMVTDPSYKQLYQEYLDNRAEWMRNWSTSERLLRPLGELEAFPYWLDDMQKKIS